MKELSDNELGILSSIKSLDPFLHEPSRLTLVAYLSVVGSADFTFLVKQTQMSPGNLSAQMIRLEDAGYVNIKKVFVGRKPRTRYSLTNVGREAVTSYRESLTPLLALLPA